MSITDICLLAVGLAMDAFSVAVCKGLSMKKINYKGAFITALYFGFFQFLMPLIGYFLGSRFEKIISSFSHWIAFVLLLFIGGKMIYETIKDDDDNNSAEEYKIDHKELLMMAIATSIDALAVGIIFAAQKVNLMFSCSMIGIITFVLSLGGVFIGNRFGSKYEKKAGIAGGAVLVIIGVKLLLEGLGII